MEEHLCAYMQQRVAAWNSYAKRAKRQEEKKNGTTKIPGILKALNDGEIFEWHHEAFSHFAEFYHPWSCKTLNKNPHIWRDHLNT
eukprot:g5861.t1